MLYVFELDYVEGNRILKREKKFQAANDQEAKKKGKNKWTGAGASKRRAKLTKNDNGKKTVIASYVQVSH